MYNPLLYLLKRYPDRAWDISTIISNFNFNIDVVNELHPNKIRPLICQYSVYNTYPSIIRHSKSPNNVWSDNITRQNTIDLFKVFYDDGMYFNSYSDFVKDNYYNYHKSCFNRINMSTISIDQIKYILDHMIYILFNTPLIYSLGYISLLHNPNLTLQFIIDNPNYNWNYSILSCNPNITMEYIEENLNLNWSWQLIAYHPNLTTDMIKKHPNKLWCWDSYSVITQGFTQFYINPKIISFLLEEYPIIELSWDILSLHLPIEIVDKYFKKPWNFEYLSLNPNLTIDFIDKYPNMCWNWSELSKHPDLTIDFIEKYSDKLWDWNIISKYSKITIKHIKDNPNKPWNWKGISKNKNITMDIIENNLDMPWDWGKISYNPNLTINFIDKYNDKQWNWINISLNNFYLDIMINAKNKIYNCWKRKNIRCRIAHRCKLKYVLFELKASPPMGVFSSGIDYFEALSRFNTH